MVTVTVTRPGPRHILSRPGPDMSSSLAGRIRIETESESGSELIWILKIGLYFIFVAIIIYPFIVIALVITYSWNNDDIQQAW